jgi:hypothetical protein
MGSLRADEWSRVGEYLDRLAFENDRLEAELKLKKQRRLEREAALAKQTPVKPVKEDARLEEVTTNSPHDARTVCDATSGMNISYEAMRSDLSGLISELNEFKSARATLAARLGA